MVYWRYGIKQLFERRNIHLPGRNRRPAESPRGFHVQGTVYPANGGISCRIAFIFGSGNRAEYQVARLEATYLQKGDNWEKAPTVYQISILNFNYTPKHKGESDGKDGGELKAKTPVSRYAMRTKDGRELSNTLNIIFVELPKAQALEESLETNTALENWAIFLKEADNPKKANIIRELTSKEAGLMNAHQLLSTISANRDLWLAQYHQELHERDRISGLYAARKEGVEEGRKAGLEEGRKAGLEEGKKESSEKTARAMLADGVPVAHIAKWTGVSIEDIEKL